MKKILDILLFIVEIVFIWAVGCWMLLSMDLATIIILTVVGTWWLVHMD